MRVRLRVTVPSERHFVVLDDALPAGLEAVDLSLRTVGGVPGPGCRRQPRRSEPRRSRTDEAARVGVRQLGRRLVVALRSQGDARRQGGLRRDAALAGQLYRDLPGARDDAGRVRPAAGARGGDVQPRGVRGERRRGVHGDGEGEVRCSSPRCIPSERGILAGRERGAPQLADPRCARDDRGSHVRSPARRLAPRPLARRSAAPGLVLLDRAGLPLRSTRAADGSLRRWVPLAEMDPDLLAAFLAVEDRRFYRHPGVDLPRPGRAAALADLRARRIVAGGSTITMQLARLLRPSAADLEREGGAGALGAPARAAVSPSRPSSSSTSTACRWGRARSAWRPPPRSTSAPTRPS